MKRSKLNNKIILIVSLILSFLITLGLKIFTLTSKGYCYDRDCLRGIYHHYQMPIIIMIIIFIIAFIIISLLLYFIKFIARLLSK